MSKHSNKHWLREKEFISLNKELDELWDTLPLVRWRRMPNTRVQEINARLRHKFYNEYHGRYHTAPKHYRKTLNRIQRAKSKETLYKILDGKEAIFEDCYRGCNWYW